MRQPILSDETVSVAGTIDRLQSIIRGAENLMAVFAPDSFMHGHLIRERDGAKAELLLIAAKADQFDDLPTLKLLGVPA